MPRITLQSTDEEVIAEMERIRVLYKLKETLRYQTVRDTTVHSESVAEHIFAAQIISNYFLTLEDPEQKLDRVRISELILFHELGEIETGDVVFHNKTDALAEEEKRAARRVIKRLPASMQKVALARIEEFEECTTPEGKWADAIDRMEPIFEMFEPLAMSAYKRMGITHKIAVGKKRVAAESYPYMLLFLGAWERRAVSLDVFPA